jgi:ATP/maltotriose-dependent transcriptional regulator MalT
MSAHRIVRMTPGLLLTRRNLRLGLHRLRVEGELTEIRREDLRFSLGESRALMEAGGIRLSDGALESLVARTEGRAAGLRLRCRWPGSGSRALRGEFLRP